MRSASIALCMRICVGVCGWVCYVCECVRNGINIDSCVNVIGLAGVAQ